VTALPFPFPTRPEQLETPTWTQFLHEIFEADESRMDLLQEAFGYCFFQDTSLETFFVFHGMGRNGKSTVLSVLRELLGERNVSSLSPEQLADRFLVGQLYGKYANICADMNEIDSVQEGILRAIVTGDLVTADRKYKDAMQFRSRAKLFFATNVLPRFTDTTLATWRRMILLPFDYICPLDKVDTHLFDKLQRELSGIFLWALQGTLRLRDNRRFSASDRCGAAARKYRLSCFPILMFLEECTVSEGTIAVGELWDAYKRWCTGCGLTKIKPMHVFADDVLRFEPRIQYQRPKKEKEMTARVPLYGIGLRPDLESSLPVGSRKEPAGVGEQRRWFN